jgi:hypothetical protein
MKIFEPLFIKVIEELLECKVDFLLIGGYAVNYYGYGRYTGDIDFWLRPTEENKINFLKAFRHLKKNDEEIEAIRNLDFTKAQVISIGAPPLRIDFLTRVNLINFNEAWDSRKLLVIKNISLPIVNYEHLILTKFNTGRPKDKLDLDELQRINHTTAIKEPTRLKKIIIYIKQLMTLVKRQK